MEIEYMLYHLYVHSIFASNIGSTSKMNMHIYHDYNTIDNSTSKLINYWSSVIMGGLVSGFIGTN